MKYSPFFGHPLLLILALVTASNGVVGGQKPIKCQEEKKDPLAPHYQTGWTTYSAKEPKTFFLAISINSRYFNRDDMIALAHRISKDFCHERRLEVEIFDQRTAARKFFPTSEIEWFHKHWRGTYLLDRDTGSESISFSTAPDKPKGELRILLDPAGKNQ
jgi:hypothetical protein